MHVLIFNDRIAGRFNTREAAWVEGERLARLAFKRGQSSAMRVQWERPLPRTEREADEEAHRERVGSM